MNIVDLIGTVIVTGASTARTDIAIGCAMWIDDARRYYLIKRCHLAMWLVARAHYVAPSNVDIGRLLKRDTRLAAVNVVRKCQKIIDRGAR